MLHRYEAVRYSCVCARVYVCACVRMRKQGEKKPAKVAMCEMPCHVTPKRTFIVPHSMHARGGTCDTFMSP